MEGIYQRIETLCRDKGITITDMCRDCAIPRATLSDYKQGRVKSLSVAVVSKIATYFSVSTDFLMNGVDSNEAALKVALFGGSENVTEAMWNEVKRYAKYIRDRENEN